MDLKKLKKLKVQEEMIQFQLMKKKEKSKKELQNLLKN
jgi:hypothetical protein